MPKTLKMALKHAGITLTCNLLRNIFFASQIGHIYTVYLVKNKQS